MPAKQDPNIGLNYGWTAGESGINLQLDENWRTLGALLQLSVISKTTDVPAAPVAGDRYIIPAGATGVWAGHQTKVAVFIEGVWELFTPLNGWLAYVQDIAQYQFFNGAGWAPAPIDSADQVAYDNAASGLSAIDAQAAIDELATGGTAPVQSVDGLTGDVDLSADYEPKRQNNLSATVDPTVTDDSAAGYETLSRWVNTTTGEIWLCLDATPGAANWQQATLTLDELGSAAVADVGIAADQVPRNSDLGSAAVADVGIAADQVPRNSDLGSAAVADVGIAADQVPRNSDLGSAAYTPATDYEVAGAVAAHEAATDPHPQYLTDALYAKDRLRESLLKEATLNLDFTQNEYGVYEGPVTGMVDKSFSEAVTFTRTSEATARNATGKIVTVGTGLQRLVGNREGLLIEEQRTNLLLWSEDFSNAAWGKYDASIVSNATNAPDGTLTADKLIWANGAGTGRVYQNISVSVNPYTVSFFAKAAELSKVTLRTAANQVGAYRGSVFDLSLKTATAGDGFASAAITDVGGGWFLCTTTATPTAISNAEYQITNNGTGASGDGTSGIYIWGAQLEQGSFATSYIPTKPTFVSRASTGTYFDSAGVMQTAAVNVARINHKLVSGKWVSEGLLIEEQRTNRLLWSEDFGNAAWAKNGTVAPTVTPNVGVAPDGSATADRLQIPERASRVYQAFTSPTVNTFSIWLKSNTSAPQIAYLVLRAVGFGVTYAEKGIEVSTEWARYSITGDCTANANGIMAMVYNSNTGGSNNWDLLAWGAQLEVGSSATSYIPTTTAQVTRAADVVSMAQVTRAADNASRVLGQEFNATNWTLFFDLSKINIKAGQRIITISDGTESNRLQMEVNSNDNNAFNVAAVSGGATAFVATIIHAGKPKFAISYRDGVFRFSVDGTTAASRSASIPGGLSKIIIGNNSSGNQPVNAVYKRTMLIPRALSTTELQALTS